MRIFTSFENNVKDDNQLLESVFNLFLRLFSFTEIERIILVTKTTKIKLSLFFFLLFLLNTIHLQIQFKRLPIFLRFHLYADDNEIPAQGEVSVMLLSSQQLFPYSDYDYYCKLNEEE